MLTLDGVIEQASDLRYAVQPTGPARPVVGVWPANRGDSPRRREGARDTTSWRGFLALVAERIAPEQCEPLVATLARGGASGIVTTPAAPQELLAAGREHALPVVFAEAEAASPRHLARIVADLHTAHAESEAKAVRELLECAATSDAEERIGRWLASAIDADVLLVAPYQVTPAMLATGEVIPPERIAAIAEGESIAADDLMVEGLPVQLYGLNVDIPRHVLVVTRRKGWPGGGRESVSLAARTLAGVLRHRAASEAERSSIRTAVLQLLLDGHVLAARHAARPSRLAANALRAAEVRVCVASVRHTRRTSIATALQHHLGADGLAAMSTTDPQHITIVIPEDQRVQAGLRAFLGRFPWAYTGVSRVVPLEAVSVGHSQALQALGAASDQQTDRWAEYRPIPDLASVLPIDRSYRWQQKLFEPLESLATSESIRALWLETLHLMLANSTAIAARAKKVDPNTVRARAEAISVPLGLDYRSFPDRVVLDLALKVSRLRLKAPTRSDDVTLAALLTTRQAQDWAQEFVNRLPDELLTVLSVWMGVEAEKSAGATERAAQQLNIPVKALRRHLHEAEGLLGRALISTPEVDEGMERGVYELALALHITHALPRPILTPHHTER